MTDVHKVTLESSKLPLLENTSNQDVQDDVHDFSEKEKDLGVKYTWCFYVVCA